MYGYDHFGMGLGGLGMILVWVAPLLLLVWLVMLFRRGGDDRESGKKQSAKEILAARYARGEIDREEYLKRRADLET